jgi:uncharacterized protein (DUF362 family)
LIVNVIVAHQYFCRLLDAAAYGCLPGGFLGSFPDSYFNHGLLCLEAEAKSVIVTDISCNEPRSCFERSGIAAAARKEGAQVLLPEERRFRVVNIPGEALGAWPVLEPFIAADKIINVPIAKHHNLTGVTLGMKNWYGIIGGHKRPLHQQIHESLVDLADFMRPTLTIIDCYRILLRNGPTGGDLGDVALKKALIAGTDPVALDAYAAKVFWDLDHNTLRYLKLAQDRGLGTMAFETLRVGARRAVPLQK